MPVATGDAFRYITTQGTNVGESNATLIAPDVNGTLTVVGGFGITLTADPANQKITITNTGNGTGALTTITTQNSAGTYYPIFTRAPLAGDFNPNSGTYQMSTMYYETTTDPLTYNPGSGLLSVVGLSVSGHATIEGVTTTGATGTGNIVFSSSPTLVTPTLGAASATSINGLTISSSTGTFTLTNAKTFAVQNSITLAGTDGTTITLPSTTGTVALNNQTFYLGSTQIAINRTTGSLALTGVSIDGSAGSVAAANITGTTLASSVTGSSLTSFGSNPTLSGATLSGTTTISQSVETFTSPTITSNAVTLNFNLGAIFALGSNSANITANFTNIPGTAGQVISTTLIITQGATPYIPSAITINSGGSVTPKWQGGSAPSGTANHIDIVSLIFICTATNTWTTIGALVDYN